MKEKKVASLKIVFEDGNDYSLACQVGLDKDEVIKYIERAFRPEPAEPLIKDEKIRKAMKVWARLNDVKEVMFDKYWHSFRDADMVISFLFTFKDFDCLEDGAQYTITELCGEEDE